MPAKNLQYRRDKAAMILCLIGAAVLAVVWGVLEYRKEPIDSCECRCMY